MKKIFIKNVISEETSEQLALDIYKNYLKTEENFVLFLDGGLGAGKSFFVDKLLQGFGVDQRICSPTYTYVNEYTGKGEMEFAHFDFYRLADPADFYHKGFEEIASDETVSCFVEWKDKITPEMHRCFSGKVYILQIEFGVGVGMRKIKFYEL